MASRLLALCGFFLLGILYDGLWCLCVRATASHRPALAAGTSAALVASGLFVNFSVISSGNLPAAAAYILGCALGTYLIVRFDARQP